MGRLVTGDLTPLAAIIALLLSNLTWAMLVIMVGLFCLRIKVEWALLIVSLLIAVVGVAGGEIWFVNIRQIPMNILSDVFLSPVIVAGFVGIVLGTVINNLAQARASSETHSARVFIAQKVLLASFGSLIPMLILTKQTSRIGTDLILVLSVCCVLSALMFGAIAWWQRDQDGRPAVQIGIRDTLVRFMSIVVAWSVFGEVFRRANGEHVLLAAIRSVELGPVTILVCCLALLVIATIVFDGVKAAMLVSPFLNPLAFVLRDSFSEIPLSALYVMMVVGCATILFGSFFRPVWSTSPLSS